ncbi:glycosyltransferase [Leptospirillum ferriphilum]|uniref:glycosyltransferase n=1 Tax=Leptospirillum ferriphilum TaxID=178606 RepID=UPI0006B200A6|nr:glycosyltransferase [Leptospirillum ferriphilum]
MVEKNSLKNIKILVFQKSGYIGGAEKNLQRWVKYFHDKYNTKIILCGPGNGKFFEEMEVNGCEISRSDLPDWRKGKNFLKRYIIRSKIWNSYRNKNSVNLIFSNDFFYSPYAVYLGKKLNIPVIVHIQSDLEPKRINQYSLNHADGVIITTRSTYKKISPFFKPNVLKMIPCGVEYPLKPISFDPIFQFDQEKKI